MDIKKCLICGKDFYRKSYRNKKSWSSAKFCSHKCYSKSLIGQDRGGRIKLECEWCKKTYHQWKHIIERQGSRFCSQGCARKGKRKRKKTYLICKYCKNSFYSGHLKSKFCSRKCYYSFYKKYPEKHKRWKGGKSSEYVKFINTKPYKQWRKSIFERDNYICQICGFKNGSGEHRDLHPHHLVSASKYPEFRLCLDNGLTVCYKCHGVIHSINFKNKKYKKKEAKNWGRKTLLVEKLVQ